jgi:hypothetical protein
MSFAFEMDSLKISDVVESSRKRVIIEEGKYPVTNTEVVSVSALETIKKILQENLITIDRYGARLIEEKDLKHIFNEIGTDWMSKQGSWPKRFAKVFKKRRNQKFGNNLLSKIGQIARDSCNLSQCESLTVTKDFDWTPGLYGDTSSCFWTSRSGAKFILRDADALALLLYGDSHRPMGRAWCVPYGNDYIIFNAYAREGEPITIVSFARILSDTFGFDCYRDIIFTNREMEDGPLWINGGLGFIVGNQNVSTITEVDIDYPLYCSECDEECCDEAHIDDSGSGVMCESCVEGSIFCENCDARVSEDTVIYVNDTPLCERCFEKHAFSCYECGEVDWVDNAHKHNGNYFCEYCFDRCYTYCEECDSSVDRDLAVDVTVDSGIEVWCPSCLDDRGFICKSCEDSFENSMMSSEDGLCRHCCGQLGE